MKTEKEPQYTLSFRIGEKAFKKLEAYCSQEGISKAAAHRCWIANLRIEEKETKEE